MAWIRIGRFNNFNGADTLLIEAGDGGGLGVLIGLVREVVDSGSGLQVDGRTGVIAHGGLRVRFEIVPEDRGLIVQGSQIVWRRSPDAWVEIVEEIAALRATGVGHQYLDGPADDLQIMVSIGEYSEAWWKTRADEAPI